MNPVNIKLDELKDIPAESIFELYKENYGRISILIRDDINLSDLRNKFLPV